jgi:hypothetical protein
LELYLAIAAEILTAKNCVILKFLAALNAYVCKEYCPYNQAGFLFIISSQRNL